jgi:hypothetical protein
LLRGDAVLFTPQAGLPAHDYLLTLTATLSTGQVLVEQVLMQVREVL